MPAYARGGRSHRLVLTGLAAAVLGVMLTVLWPTTEPPPATGPDVPFSWVAPPPVTTDATASTEPLSPSAPAASSSVAGVSSSRPVQPSQTSAPSPSPTRAGTTRDPGTPPARPSSPTSQPASPSPTSRPTNPPPTTRPPEPQELRPLPASRERGLRSVSGGAETSVEFVNLSSRPLILYWLDHQGRRRHYAVLQPSASYRQHTYVGHPWVVTDRRGRALACFEPTRTPARAVIR
ncbi:hypothetical protein [Micromonospora sp. WMMD1082]|uniref:VHL beta domain-containing protein n=1 Tax=Micromonospora sp. WMMD1082 TaxID=3016104 RepID=UPI002417141A|nr:hypothetical protein [Micromonospora sp. WMMD1082]MDG4795350.1 hypothetical protein [Micromonospora sp. WMMD1082]